MVYSIVRSQSSYYSTHEPITAKKKTVAEPPEDEVIDFDDLGGDSAPRILLFCLQIILFSILVFVVSFFLP